MQTNSAEARSASKTSGMTSQCITVYSQNVNNLLEFEQMDLLVKG